MIEELKKQFDEKYSEVGKYADDALIDGTPPGARSIGISKLKSELGEIAIKLVVELENEGVI